MTVWSGADYSVLDKLYGDNAKDYFGSAVGSGDINSDGFADFVIGIPGYDALGTTKQIQSAGKVTLISGAAL